jgi:hypothetical protein
MFLSMALYIKRREKIFLKHGKTHEDYQKYLKTNRNSFQFAKFMTVTIIIYSIIDLILCVILGALYIVLNPEVDAEKAVKIAYNWGFGETANMMSLIPVMFLYSYTKVHKYKLLDIAIPITGVAMVVLLYLDSLFMVIKDLLVAGVQAG